MTRRFRSSPVLMAVVSLALVLILGSCDFIVKPRNNQLRVGAILALSGPASYIGVPERNALEDYAGQINDQGGIGGKRVVIDFRDSEGKPARARQHFEELAHIADVLAVIGPSTSGESLDLAPLAQQQAVSLLSLAASSRIVVDEEGKTRPWVFKFAQNDSLAAERLAKLMRDDGNTIIALFYSNDGFGSTGAKAFEDDVNKHPEYSLQLVFKKDFQPSDTSFPTLISQIPKAVNSILIWGARPAPAKLVAELRRTGRFQKTQIYLSHGNASLDFITDAGAKNAQGVKLVGSKLLVSSQLPKDDPQFEVIGRFDSLWHQKRPSIPQSHFAGHARDAMDFVRAAIESGANDRKSLRAKLELVGKRPGVTGVFQFSELDHAGLTADSLAPLIIRDQGFVLIAPK